MSVIGIFVNDLSHSEPKSVSFIAIPCILIRWRIRQMIVVGDHLEVSGIGWLPSLGRAEPFRAGGGFCE